MNAEAALKLTRARIAMIMKQPFFGTLALNLILVEDDTLNPPTAAVDGKRLYYHPQWVLDNPHGVVMSMVGHEVGHCIFEHIGRRNARNPRRWNMAGDYVINLVLEDCGFEIPSTWLLDRQYAGMSTDQVYALLPEGIGGSKEPFDGIGEVAEHFDKIEWDIAAVQAGQAAKHAGNIPGSLARFIKDITESRADWRTVMRRFMTDVSREDYSYQRVNRKFATLGIFLPGLYSESMGSIVSAIDTSGSITNEVLQAFGSEISEIRSQVKPTSTHVIYCDAAVNHVDEFDEYDDFKVTPHGGGGTDFRPPFKWLSDRGIEPKCMVYLTDGYGPFPDQPPPFPVLWLMTTDIVPPWGEVIRIEA